MKRTVLKKMGAVIISAVMMTMLGAGVTASEITDINDENYNGDIWQDIESKDELAIHDSHISEASIETNEEPDYIKLGNASAKIKRTGGSDHGINILLASKKIPQKTGKAVKAISIDVYVPAVNDNNAENAAIGSTVSGYVKTSAPDSYLNGAYNWIEARTLQEGWNTVVFDAVNGTEMPYFVWREATTHDGVIYVDNIRVYYQTVTSVYDSFENFEDDWKPQDGGYTLSQNTNMQYVKDGKGSLKIDCPVHGDSNFIISKLEHLTNYYGRQIPRIEGYTAKTIGLWVYSDGVRGEMKPRSNSCAARAITKDGWQYLAWTIPDGSADGNATDWFSKDHLNKIRLTVTTAGTLYVDAMTIEYADDSETILDSIDTFYWNAGGCYGASGYGLNTDADYIKEGIGSGKFVIPANKDFDNGEYVYSNNGLGLSIPQKEGLVPHKIGFWVYGTGVEGTYLRPGFHTGGTDANNSYRPFGEINLNFSGWQYVTAYISSETEKFYNIQVKNITSTDAVVYIDKIVIEYVDPSSKVWKNELNNNGHDLNMEQLEKGDVISYDVSINNLTGTPGAYQIFIAGYDGEGRLIKVAAETIGKDETGEILKSVSFKLESDYEANMIQTVKGFIMTDELVPVIDAVEKTKTESN